MNDNKIIPLSKYKYDDIMMRFRFTSDGNHMLVEVVKPPPRYSVESIETSTDRFYIEQVLRVIKMVRGD